MTKPKLYADEPVPARASAEYEEIIDNHVANAKRMGFVKRGAVVATPQILALLPAGAFRIQSWDNKRSAVKERTFGYLRYAPVSWETRFDAAHGFRYVLVIWPRAENEAQHLLFRGAAIAGV